MVAIDRPSARAVLRRFFQLNDWEMLAAGHVDDAQAEALTASPSNRSLRPGAGSSGPAKLNGEEKAKFDPERV